LRSKIDESAGCVRPPFKHHSAGVPTVEAEVHRQVPSRAPTGRTRPRAQGPKTKQRPAALTAVGALRRRYVGAGANIKTKAGPTTFSQISRTSTVTKFQARACNTLAFRPVARSAAHRHRARRPASWPLARAGAHTATWPWRGGRGAGKVVPPPPPRRRRPAGVAQRPRAGPSPRRAAHLRAAETAHGRVGEIDRRATGCL